MLVRKSKGFVQIIPLVIISVIVLVVGASFVKIKRPQLKVTPTPVATLITFVPTLSTASTPFLTLMPKLTPLVTVTPTVKAISPPAQAGPPGAGFSTITVATEKGNFSASVLSIDLNSARVVTDTANDSDCSDNCPTLALADFVNRNAGFAGVNGSYFCPEAYPECSGKKNAFDFPVYNSRLNKWINGGNLFWNSRSMVCFDGGGAHYKQNAASFSGGLTAGIVNYPGLVDGGNVQIDDSQSGLSDKQRAIGTKVGIGIRGTKIVMVVIARNVNMQQFAYVFKALGAEGAMNLDTGGSTALYYNGKYLFGPGRNLVNAIIFVR